MPKTGKLTGDQARVLNFLQNEAEGKLVAIKGTQWPVSPDELFEMIPDLLTSALVARRQMLDIDEPGLRITDAGRAALASLE
jgi:hypothetical protein